MDKATKYLKDLFEYISYPNLEADDLMYLYCTHHSNCIISSGDGDMVTMVSEDTILYNHNKKKYFTLDNCRPDLEALSKLLKGCKSDGIPKCHKQVSIRTTTLERILEDIKSQESGIYYIQKACKRNNIILDLKQFDINYTITQYSLDVYYHVLTYEYFEVVDYITEC